MAKEAILVFPQFDKLFLLHTDASDYQLGGVISQNNKPIAFFSKKLNNAQKKYTTTKKELLAIVETTKEFKSILYGNRIIVMTDHKNLTYDLTMHTCDQVLRQRMMLEEYGVVFKYIKGEDNHVADALSRLPQNDNQVEVFVIKAKDETFLLDYGLILKEQKTDKELEFLRKKKGKTLRKTTIGKLTLTELSSGQKDDWAVYVPTNLCSNMLDWYHEMLKHPGHLRLYATI
mmetsp:Transcript_27157/g.39951  ORF Transcript_27157/g.39951 Transcript_27157/m.39951 type:complete len:231 (-) Transcript_27157:742-1434(-)